jgi:uncharacterized membrane protein YccC
MLAPRFPSPRFREAFKTALAVVLAYGIALSMDWEKPMWAAFAVAFISLATVGQSLHKGALRMLGTLVAGVVSLTLVALFPQERWWLMVFLSAFVGLCTYRMGGSKRPYFWNVAAFVSLIICMESVPATEYAFDLAVLRSLETGLGILCYTLVTVFLWPTGTAAELDAAVRGLAATQHRLYQGYLRLLAGKAEGEDLQPLRLQEVQQLGQFSDALMGARADTHEVWELRQQWARLEADVREMMAALARWRESFDEVQVLDLKALMPEFPSLAEELDARLGQIERILSGKVPEQQPKPLDASLNAEAVRALSHFDRAALALFRSQLRRLESLTRSVFETAADIKGFAAVSVRPVEPTRTRSGFVLDADDLVAAIRVVAGVWLAYLVWIYIEVPGGVGIVIMTGSLGVALATNPQLPMRLAFKPVALSIAFASILYIFVMPRLSSFTELGWLIFAVTFAICYLFYKPQQILGRVAGLAIFFTMAGISNAQSYSFLSLANTTLMFVLVFMILALAAYVPFSPQPEKAFVRLLRRFFRSCEYLVSTLDWDPDSDSARRPTRLQRWRRSYHAGQIATLPQTISLWGKSIDPKLLAGTTPEQLQALTADIQALGYRMQETLESRAAVRSVSTGPEVQNEIDTWRAGLKEIFRRLSLDPDAADHAGFRALLDGKLERLEAHIETALNQADTVSVPPTEAERAYRLLGAHRGLSEAVIAFAKQTAVIDWPRLREARF